MTGAHMMGTRVTERRLYWQRLIRREALQDVDLDYEWGWCWETQLIEAPFEMVETAS